MHAEIDHLVIAARTLAEGVAWCEATLGITPGAGGAHPLMGTHNRLLNIASAGFPRAYLEIIAIDPAVTPARNAGQARWFDLDDATLHARLAERGPHLVHFVARVPDARATLDALAQAPTPVGPIDRGTLIEAGRDTPAGRLTWQITVRDDGQRLFDGALPTVIEWGAVHPVDAMPASGLTLRTLQLTHPRAAALAGALQAIGFADLPVSTGAPNLVAVFDTPRGPVTLESKER